MRGHICFMYLLNLIHFTTFIRFCQVRHIIMDYKQTLLQLTEVILTELNPSSFKRGNAKCVALK